MSYSEYEQAAHGENPAALQDAPAGYQGPVIYERAETPHGAQYVRQGGGPNLAAPQFSEEEQRQLIMQRREGAQTLQRLQQQGQGGDFSPEEQMLLATQRQLARNTPSTAETQEAQRLQNSLQGVQRQVMNGEITPQVGQTLMQQIQARLAPITVRQSQLPILQRRMQIERMQTDNALRMAMLHRDVNFQARGMQENMATLRNESGETAQYVQTAAGRWERVEWQPPAQQQAQQRQQQQQEQRQLQYDEQLVRRVEDEMRRDVQAHQSANGSPPAWAASDQAHADEFTRRMTAARERRQGSAPRPSMQEMQGQGAQPRSPLQRLAAGSGGAPAVPSPAPQAGPQQQAQPQQQTVHEPQPIRDETPEQVAALRPEQRQALETFQELRAMIPQERHRDFNEMLELYRAFGDQRAMPAGIRARFDSLRRELAQAAQQRRASRPRPQQGQSWLSQLADLGVGDTGASDAMGNPRE